MIGFLLKLAVLLVIGILTYNYFFGSSEEKAQSEKTFSQMKEVAVSVGELAKAEKEKWDAGKYDTALEKLGATYKALREGAQKLDAGLLQRIDDLDQRKAQLQKELADIEQSKASPEQQARRKAELIKELETLKRDSDALVKDSGGR